MSLSNYISMQTAELRQTLGVSMLKSAQATQAAGAAVMLSDFQSNQEQIQAPHPYLGKNLDILM